MSLDMINPGDTLGTTEDPDLFNFSKLRKVAYANDGLGGRSLLGGGMTFFSLVKVVSLLWSWVVLRFFLDRWKYNKYINIKNI